MLISLLYCNVWNEFALQVWNLRREATIVFVLQETVMLRSLKRENGFLKKILIHRKRTLMKVFISLCSCHLLSFCTISALLVMVIDI